MKKEYTNMLNKLNYLIKLNKKNFNYTKEIRNV